MSKKKTKRQSRYHGVVVVDKPEGLTSQDVVGVIRRAAGTRRVGHTGTLDPLATGLLLILVGEATKLSEYMVGFDKTYEGTMRLGVESDTYDCQGEIKDGPGGEIPSLEKLRELTEPFTGEIEQVPPPYSAVKVKGKKLYEYARAGEKVDAKARRVKVSSYEILSMEGDIATFRVACASGTYVRSLVHELGQAAGCGALVQSLRRTETADFTLEEAVSLETFQDMAPDAVGPYLLPIVDTLTDWPIYVLEKSAETWIERGQAIPAALAHHEGSSETGRIGDLVFLVKLSGAAVAVAKVVPAPPSPPPAQLARHAGLWFQPVKLMQTSENTEK